jgi:hypothetical protein
LLTSFTYHFLLFSTLLWFTSLRPTSWVPFPLRDGRD